MCRSSWAHLSGSNLLRVLGALALLCLYVSMVLLSFTAKSKLPVPLAGPPQPLFDRTYVTTVHAEHQLPALITLAHSLMKQQSTYGLLVLIPTGRRQQKHATERQLRRKTSKEKKKRWSATDAAETVAANLVEEGPFEWSEDALIVMRSIPNLTLQMLPHIQFPTPKPKKATTTPTASTVSFHSAVKSLLMFEVWRLTAYKQVLYLDVQTIVHENLDYLLRTEFEHSVAGVAHAETPDDAHGHATASPPPGSADAAHSEVIDPTMLLERSRMVDTTIERWLHDHSFTGHTDGNHAAEVSSTSQFGPVAWADSHAILTPPWLQIAAPMQLTSEDCPAHSQIARDSSQRSVGSLPQREAGSSPYVPTFSSSLDWSLFSGNMLLLTPNSYAYHLLLSHYTHTHVERRDRFDGNALVRKTLRAKFRDAPSNFLNHFFSEPCSHSADGHQDHHQGVSSHTHGQTTTPGLASDSPLSHADGGCWHPLPFNYSLTSHTCSCEASSSSGWHGLTDYGGCAETSVWTALLDNVLETLRRCDQLTIRATASHSQTAANDHAAATAAKKPKVKQGGAKMQVQSVTSAKTEASTPASPAASTSATTSAPSGPASTPVEKAGYYSQLMSTLSWTTSEAEDRERHRFALLYLNELEEHALAQIDDWAGIAPKVTDDGKPPSTTTTSDPSAAPIISSCCRSRYRRVLRAYFEGLLFLRPNFDEARYKKKKRGGF